MRVVVDTGELLRMAAATHQSPLFVAWEERQIILVMSPPTMAELVSVLSRPKTQRFLPRQRGERFLNLLRQRALFVDTALDYPACRDPGDGAIIATAVAGLVDYLITIDKDIYDDPQLVSALQKMNIRVIRPGAFFGQLRRSQFME
jgi:putative PIN family toxin of toxin-antitoxin system